MNRLCLFVVFTLFVSQSSANWTTPVPLTEINSAEKDYAPFLSSDGLTLYFTRMNSGYNIYTATRSTPSGTFSNIALLNLNADYSAYSWVSPDNLRLYFHSQYRLMMSERTSTSSPWSTPVSINELNTLGSMNTAKLTPDELTIVFCSSSNISEGKGDYDIYTATRQDRFSAFQNIRNVGELNTSRIDAHPFITADGLAIYFISDRDGEPGENRIYKATRPSIEQPFGNIEHMTIFDTPDVRSECPFLSTDETTFLFAHGDIYVSYIPEPATLALLGLGGLLLNKCRHVR